MTEQEERSILTCLNRYNGNQHAAARELGCTRSQIVALLRRLERVKERDRRKCHPFQNHESLEGTLDDDTRASWDNDAKGKVKCLPVPGGWLYCWEGTGMVFVPKPKKR